MDEDLQRIFDAVGVSGSLCAETSDSESEVALHADTPVVAGSVFKVLVAVEVVRQIAAGDLDPREPVRLPASPRTPGFVGFSLYEQGVEVGLADLVVPMLTISDNVATDALLNRVGIAACNETALQLGLSQTVIVSDLRTMIEDLARAAGFNSWDAMIEWSSGTHSDEERLAVDRLARAAPQLTVATATRTTPRDMCRLLQAIWTDRAAPPKGCRRIRGLMSRQLTRNRLASGFVPPVRIAAKSGGLLGFFRHEVGVVQFPDRWFPVAVFTLANETNSGEAAINAAIGQAAARAIALL